MPIDPERLSEIYKKVQEKKMAASLGKEITKIEKVEDDNEMIATMEVSEFSKENIEVDKQDDIVRVKVSGHIVDKIDCSGYTGSVHKTVNNGILEIRIKK